MLEIMQTQTKHRIGDEETIVEFAKEKHFAKW